MPREHGTGVFDYGVLESSTGAEEWETVLAGESNGSEGAVGAAVGRIRDDPDAVEGDEVGAGLNGFRFDPLVGDRRGSGGPLEGHGNRAVGGHLGIVIAD